MAVSDAELIQLLKGAEAGTRGPQGEAGIGIADVQQPDPNGFVITLTNGKTHRIELAAGRDGAPGSPAKTARMAVLALLEAQEHREAQLLAEPIPGETESME